MRNRWGILRQTFLAPVAVLVACAAVGMGPRVASATDLSGECPASGLTAADSPWNLTGTVTVSASTTCVVEAGVQIVGNGNALVVQAGGTLTAVGTSAAQRDVQLSNVALQFNGPSAGMPAGSGTLENCALTTPLLDGAAISITDASPTVRHCTIDGHGGISIGGVRLLTPAQPLITGNQITVDQALPAIRVVGTAQPSITGNQITTDGVGIAYGDSAQGTASQNTVGFVPESSPGRIGISVSDGAAPVIEANTITDDPTRADTAIRVTVDAGVAVEVTANTLHATGTDDHPLELAPDAFGPGPLIDGNLFPDGMGGGIALSGVATGAVTIGVLEGQSSYRVTGSLGVATGGEMTVAAGIALAAGQQGNAIFVSAGGTFTAEGTSEAQRDIQFSNLYVQFFGPSGATPAASGTLENCVITAPQRFNSYAVYITDASPTVRHCTISGPFGGLSIAGSLQLTPAQPLITGNAITVASPGTVPPGIDVGGTAQPSLMDNQITTNGVGIRYSGSAQGTASGNSIGFTLESNPGRVGISVSGSAAPVIDANTVADDPTRADTGIRVAVDPGVAVKVTNNTLHATGTDDHPLELAPDVFSPGPTISGNLFPDGVAGGIALNGAATSSPTIGMLEGQSSYRLTGSLGVAAGGHLTVAPGTTLAAGQQGSVIYVAAGATLFAVGTSSAQRDIQLSNVYLQFYGPSAGMPAADGTLENCTITGPALFNGQAIQITDASPTVRHCTIAGSPTGISIGGSLQLTPAQPLISGNQISVTALGIDVGGTAQPSLMDNQITTNGVGISFGGSAQGMASGNTIGFVLESNDGRTAIRVSDSAQPVIDGNTVADDPSRNDTGILLLLSAGNTVQVTDNSICATGQDVCLGIDLDHGFSPTAEQIHDNTNPCSAAPCLGTTAPPTPTRTASATPSNTDAATSTLTPAATSTATVTSTMAGSPTLTPTGIVIGSTTPTPTATPAVTAVISGLCRRPGAQELEPCAAGTQVSASRCSDRGCTALEPLGETTTDAQGQFTLGLDAARAAGARLLLSATVASTGAAAGARGAVDDTAYRVIDFGPVGSAEQANVPIDPASEAAVQLMEERGLQNYSDARVQGVVAEVEMATADSDYAGLSPAEAVGRAKMVASAAGAVLARLACGGDCDLFGATTINELILAVNIALGTTPATACEAADSNADDQVTINELLEAVNSALTGCSIGPPA